MIGYLKGQVLEHEDGRMLVGMGDASTGVVGYSVTVPQGPEYLDFMPGRQAELFVYTHVREDALDLYGFSTRMQKELFLTLLTVNGIGPKVAMGILSRVSPSRLVQAILEQDKDSLVQIPGIGKKTAERVVLELSDPLKKKVETGGFGDYRKEMSGRDRSSSGTGQVVDSGKQGLVRDAVGALVGLGYREQEINPLLNRLMAEESSLNKVEDLIRTALKHLG